MTKVCTLLASPNENGVTARALRAFTDSLNNATIEKYSAFKLNAAPCIGCGACKETEGCIYSDLDAFFASLESSDLLIIATPVYCLSVPAPMKAIIDRFQRYYNARFSLGKRPAIEKPRRAVIIMTAGSHDENGRIIIHQLERSFSVMNTVITDSVMLNGTDGHVYSDEEISELISGIAWMTDI